ncbi:MAG: hypothetical protein SFV53_05805 [Rickettsiales bacterium]|nr:hypothetical protein [Rickettsiales bacterium]
MQIQSLEALSKEQILQNFYSYKIPLLKKVCHDFSMVTLLNIKVGVELEFYLTNRDGSQIFTESLIDDFIKELFAAIAPNSLIYKIEKEQGAGQIEIKTTYTSDLLKIAEEISQIKLMAKDLANKKNLAASFASQQFINDCGSSLQFNISLHNQNDKNLFASDEIFLRKIAQGLLHFTNSMMIFLAPKEQDYARFSYDLNLNLFKKGKFTAPVNLSFGSDNRTCAIRFPAPAKFTSSFSKRLEYRVAAADADVSLCLSAILLAILWAVQNEIESSSTNAIYGNAFDKNYNLQNLCQNLNEAEKNFFTPENFIKNELSKNL